jgi:uncharacterized protein
MKNEFWKTKTLAEMTPAEWESLCDGCARCCLYKLEDEDTGEYFYTNVVCRFLNTDTCRCTVYDQRTELMPTCVALNVRLAGELKWMPASCAYRLLAEGQPLPTWHPLVSGNPNSIHEAGISVEGITLAEDEVDMENLEEYVINDDDAFYEEEEKDPE